MVFYQSFLTQLIPSQANKGYSNSNNLRYPKKGNSLTDTNQYTQAYLSIYQFKMIYVYKY